MSNEKQLLQSVRGTSDLLPNDQPLFQRVNRVFADIAIACGFKEISLPIFEYSWLFQKGVGSTSDIATKEMYYLHHKEGDNLDIALRPEGTAGIVRAYYEHGMHTWSQPVRLFYSGPMFRHERPQKGRERQFTQFGIESIGESDSSEDALVILAACQALYRLQIKPENFSVHINSIGCTHCRPKYIKKLLAYIKTRQGKLCDDCLLRAETNPMRVLDCKNKTCQAHTTDAPNHLDHLCDNCKNHFKSTLEYLEEAGISFNINHRIVRGLDYYTRTVFELIAETGTLKGQALGAGGRYDNLVATYGRRKAPAVGFSAGVERVITILKDLKLSKVPTEKPQVFVIQLGSSAKKKAFSILRQLLAAGIKTASSLSSNSLKTQLKMATKNNVRFALIIGQRELLDKTVIIKDLQNGSQETVDLKQYLAILLERLK